MWTMKVLLGTQFYAGAADAVRRQANAARSMVALLDVVLVNVQWSDESCDYEGFQTLAALRRDSRSIAGSDGPRKPIVSDVFDALAAAAVSHGSRYFMFVNSDIIVTQAAIDAVARGGRQTYAFSRADFDRETATSARILTSGIDGFAFDVDWWRAERDRFRPYILGEWFYDCVFAAIMMTFGNGVVLNRSGELRHEIHAHAVPDAARASVAFNGYLVALDAREFSLWAQYHARLAELRARCAAEAEEDAMARHVFAWRPSPGQSLRHVARCVRARARFARDRWRLTSRAAAAPR